MDFCEKTILQVVSRIHGFSKNSNKRALSINSKFFIIIIVSHFYLTSLFSSCIYNVTYFIVMSLFLQNFLSIVKINSFFLSAQKTFIDIFFSFSIFGSQVWKLFTNLSFECNYITHIL